MIDSQAHRGPDDCGVWSDDRCALGHRRLSIIDLSEAGRQPMSNARGDVLITFNGEIYNFQHLRRELERLGHSFRTRTDTEAVIYAYEQWGSGCLAHLRGMFAFGIWDRRRRRLFLARDRVGKKPLFYAQFGDLFFFASELQGLLANNEVPREVYPPAIDSYLSYGYVPAPHTAFKGVYKLPPAHYLTLDLKQTGFEKRVERYWSLDYEPKLRIGEDEACEVLREKMTEAVQLRMISDVPLGAFLSGGVDSSVVVGLMAQLSGAKVKTFSIGFNESAYDETAHARRIAGRWETDHHEFIVEPDALSILPKLVRHYGEPYADSSAIPTFYVAQMARRHVTVALNGDGGDESFAGYERYLANYLAERMRSVPGAAAAARALSRIIPDSINPKSPREAGAAISGRGVAADGRTLSAMAEDVSGRGEAAPLPPGIQRTFEWSGRRGAESAVQRIDATPSPITPLNSSPDSSYRRRDGHRRRVVSALRPAGEGRHHFDGKQPGGAFAVS